MKRPARLEVLAIGNELLDGRVADTNTLRLAKFLQPLGLEIAQRVTVVDDVDVIIREARGCIARGTDLCIVSGGLGPTVDDVTTVAIAKLAGVGLERDEAWVGHLEALFSRRGFPMTDNQRCQADRPVGAERLDNPIGTALGFALDVDGCRFACVPGVPREFDRMLAAVLEPYGGSVEQPRRVLYTFGLTEGEVDSRLADIGDRWPAVILGFRATFPEIHVTLKAAESATADLDAAMQYARGALGDAVFAERPASLAEVLLDGLRDGKKTLATAESCTGGLIGDLLTDIPGSSAVFVGGVVAYSNQSKQSLLGVSADTLESCGAVSEETVRQMAAGARQRFGADYGIAASGIAGPGGGTADKPVGTVWIAACGPNLAETRLLQLPFDRRRNKVVSAYGALDLLRRQVPTLQ